MNLYTVEKAYYYKLLRQSEREYDKNIAEQVESISDKDPKQFWEQIKKLGPQHNKHIPMQVYDDHGAVKCDRDEVLNKWKNDFKNLYNMPEDATSEFDEEFYAWAKLQKQYLESQPDFNTAFSNLDIDLSMDEIHLACSRLKSKKAVGPDRISNEALMKSSLQGVLHLFFSLCFTHHIVPKIWQKAIISPIPKSSLKDPFVPLNYRGISLLSCIYKLYSSVINNRLSSYCECNKLIDEEQNGFMPGRPCLDHVFVLSSVIRNRQINNMSTFAGFIDMKKAFDWVDRELLLFKILSQFGIKGKMYNVITSLYSNSTACVEINNYTYTYIKTSIVNMTSGVKQGDTLSPTLFSMFINDLAVDVKNLNFGVDAGGINVSMFLYADDIVLIASNKNCLQKQLNVVNHHGPTDVVDDRPPHPKTARAVSASGLYA